MALAALTAVRSWRLRTTTSNSLKSRRKIQPILQACKTLHVVSFYGDYYLRTRVSPDKSDELTYVFSGRVCHENLGFHGNANFKPKCERDLHTLNTALLHSASVWTIGFYYTNTYLNLVVLMYAVQAFLDAFPASGAPKSTDFFNFHLEFWVFSLSFEGFFLEFWHVFHVFSHKTCNFSHKTIRKLPTLWALGSSFELFPWVLRVFSER